MADEYMTTEWDEATEIRRTSFHVLFGTEASVSERIFVTLMLPGEMNQGRRQGVTRRLTAEQEGSILAIAWALGMLNEEALVPSAASPIINPDVRFSLSLGFTFSEGRRICSPGSSVRYGVAQGENEDIINGWLLLFREHGADKRQHMDDPNVHPAIHSLIQICREGGSVMVCVK